MLTYFGSGIIRDTNHNIPLNIFPHMKEENHRLYLWSVKFFYHEKLGSGKYLPFRFPFPFGVRQAGFNPLLK